MLFGILIKELLTRGSLILLMLKGIMILLKKEFMTTIEALKKIDYRTSTPEDVRNKLTDLTILCIPFYIRKGIYILRGRRGSGFTKRSQMTYCPAEKCISMQRATLKGQTMFYGVISDDQSHQENARAIVVSECSRLHRDPETIMGRESISLSYWEVIKPLHIVSLINDGTFADVKDNIILNQLREAFVLFHGEQKSSSEEKEISRFISNEFAKEVKNDNEYLISATIAYDIVKDMNFDGIVYPSVPMGGQAGLNIAITPKAVNRKLKFHRTLEQTVYKNGDHSFVRLEKADGKRLPHKQFPNSIIEKELNVESISDLPIVV